MEATGLGHQDDLAVDDLSLSFDPKKGRHQLGIGSLRRHSCSSLPTRLSLAWGRVKTGPQTSPTGDESSVPEDRRHPFELLEPVEHHGQAAPSAAVIR